MSDPNETEPSWPPPLDELGGLEIDQLKFIFDQAKRLLADTIEVRRSFENKLISLLVVSVPTALALYGVVFGFVSIRIDVPVFFAVAYSAITITISITICLFLFRPTQRYRDGSLPSEVYSQEWSKKISQTAIKNYLANEIVSYDKRCRYNLELGHHQSKWFGIAIYLIASSLVAFLLAAAFQLLPELFKSHSLWVFDFLSTPQWDDSLL